MNKKCELCGKEYPFNYRYPTKKYDTKECAEVKSLMRRSVDILMRKGLYQLQISILFGKILEERF